MRLFFAIELPDEVRERIVETQASVRADVNDSDWRWTKPEMLHVTLAFLGNVADEELENVKAFADETCSQVAATELSFERIGCFPAWKSPKVLWVGAFEETGALANLGDSLTQKCAGESGAVDKVLLHVTIARARTKFTRAHGRGLADLLEERVSPCGSATVNQIVLFQSTAGQNGPVQHIPLEKFPLKS